jgi:hypothetical protein
MEHIRLMIIFCVISGCPIQLTSVVRDDVLTCCKSNLPKPSPSDFCFTCNSVWRVASSIGVTLPITPQTGPELFIPYYVF